MKQIVNLLSYKRLFDLSKNDEKVAFFLQIYQILKIKTDVNTNKTISEMLTSHINGTEPPADRKVYKEYTFMGVRVRVKQKNDPYQPLVKLRKHIDSMLVTNEN